MSGVRIEYDVPVTMRDGVVLRADVYRPSGDGPWPVIVARTPYGKTDHYELSFLDPLLAARRGFIAVVQDVRGRYASEGEFIPFVHEAADGADTIEWAATLEQANGSVGMWGLSYLGNVQWQAAAERPGPLKAIAPERTFRSPADGLTHRGGAIELGLVRAWGLAAGLDVLARRHGGDPGAAGTQMLELVNALDHLPGRTYEEVPTGTDPILDRLSLPNLAAPDVMEAADVSRLEPLVDLPSLHVAGWYDVFSQGTIDNFLAASRRSPSKLVIGPWNHVGQDSMLGDLNFGLAGNGHALDMRTTLLDLTFDWLEGWLTDVAPSQETADPVLLFVMGANRWRSEPGWPLAGAEDTQLFLVGSDGLDWTTGGDRDASCDFTYDPHDPVPTLGGAGHLPHRPAGAMEQALVEARPDVLVFTSAPLEEDVEVTGRVSAMLTVSTDASTTDWVVRLCDVHPDGRSYNVVDGIKRISAVPGERQQVQVDLWSTSMLFKQGHRLRVQITSSCFPRWDRNPNVEDGLTSGELQPAKQRLYTGGGAASVSYLTLPLVRTRDV